MDFLIHNPIADMRGGAFLLLYLLVVAGAIVSVVMRRRSADDSEGLPPLPIPQNPDPYQIACLRGGENEVARLTLLSLIEQGYLEVDAGSRQIRRRTPHPDTGRLLPHERKVFDWCSTARDAKELLDGDAPKMAVRTAVAGYEQWFQREHLLLSKEGLERLRRAARNAILLIAGLGGYKLLVALVRGRSNVAFLIVLGLGGCLAVFLRYRTQPRLSARGTAYLRNLRTAFEGLKGGIAAPASAGSVNPALLLGVAVFGSGLLAGTLYDSFRSVYRRGEASSMSSCGSSCGSGSDGGSDSGSGGDGGGGDGGGGGCGGCGGGGGE